MKTPKKIKKTGATDLDVENSLTSENKNSKHLIDDDEEFDEDLDDLGDFDDLSEFEDEDDEF